MLVAQGGILDIIRKGVRESVHISRRHQPPSRPVHHYFGVPTHSAGHDGQTGRHRLQQRVGNALIERRQGEHIEPP